MTKPLPEPLPHQVTKAEAETVRLKGKQRHFWETLRAKIIADALAYLRGAMKEGRSPAEATRDTLRRFPLTREELTAEVLAAGERQVREMEDRLLATRKAEVKNVTRRGKTK